MAKFKDLHLLVQEEQRILFGDDSLGTYGPAEYPATNLGSEKPFIAYTTISGYNDELPGGGIINIVATEQLVVSVPLAGERGTQPYHMVRFDQLQDAIFDEVSSDWQDSVLTFSGTPPGAPSDNDRYIVEATATGDWTGLEDYIVEWNTASGTWDTHPPNEGFTTFVEDEDKYYLYYNGSWAPMGEGIDHGDLKGLSDDDHIMYVPTDGSRGFTNTVSGIDPIEDYELATKFYVDSLVVSVSGSHGDLLGLDADDHLQYILVDGTRGFTGTVSGVDPTESYHLTTRWYVDDVVDTVSGVITDQIITDHGGLTGLGDDDHMYYVPTDGSRGFTSTVSGIDPVEDYDLATKFYVDDEIGTLSGTIINQIITDHGELTGLGDDDHTQYILEDGTRAFSGTVSGIYPTETDHLTTKEYVDEVVSTSGTQKWGRESCILNARDQSVTFDNAFADDSYTVVATLTNEVEAKPSIYSTVQGVKTAGGFTTHFSGKIDSANFILEWIAFYGTQS